ncbi:UNVERIFIED_CONTAM: Interferon regulatory factor 2 [Trichonephila clavipes]
MTYAVSLRESGTFPDSFSFGFATRGMHSVGECCSITIHFMHSKINIFLPSFKMPSRGRKFITEFLLPNLNTKKFGPRLEWLDAEKKIFQVQWNHKAACDWKESDAAVFAEWDKHKGHYKPDDKEYFSKSKQRFRAVLYKFINSGYIKELKSNDKNVKIYCIDSKEAIPSFYSAKIKKTEDINDKISGKISMFFLLNDYGFILCETGIYK